MNARIESGERRIDVVELLVLARAIGVDARDILSKVMPAVEPDQRL